jgi:hypothetical protein
MFKFVICLCFGLIFMTCISGVIRRQKEIQKYFGMPAYVGAVPEHIQSAVLKSTNLGSSRQEVDRFLQSRGIGIDGKSSCYTKDIQDRLTCAVGIDNYVWELVQERYAIVFDFDSHQKLMRIEVNTEFEGPLR